MGQSVWSRLSIATCPDVTDQASAICLWAEHTTYHIRHASLCTSYIETGQFSLFPTINMVCLFKLWDSHHDSDWNVPTIYRALWHCIEKKSIHYRPCRILDNLSVLPGNDVIFQKLKIGLGRKMMSRKPVVSISTKMKYLELFIQWIAKTARRTHLD